MKTNLLAIGVAGALLAAAPAAFAVEHTDGMYEGDDHAAHYAEMHADDIAAAIAAEDRPQAHKERDATRQPEVTLAFSQIEPGFRVMDVGSSSGYYTMLLSGLVGSEGHVTGENAPVWEERYGANWPEAQAAMQETRGNVDFQTAPLDDLGVEPDSYDAITFMLNYHDTVLLPLDREAMDRAFFDALRPGGLMMISDHAGPGVRTEEQVGEVHRIDPEMVREEMEAAGFELIASSDGLANPDDDHTLNVFDPAVRGHTDRFLYLFQKPE